jgi:hypothetical protein
MAAAAAAGGAASTAVHGGFGSKGGLYEAGDGGTLGAVQAGFGGTGTGGGGRGSGPGAFEYEATATVLLTANEIHEKELERCVGGMGKGRGLEGGPGCHAMWHAGGVGR